MIRTLQSFESPDGTRYASEVEVTDGILSPGTGRQVGTSARRSWEFGCHSCEAFDTNLSEDEARDELESHRCTRRPGPGQGALDCG